jgi:putative NADH-flavin reductase
MKILVLGISGRTGKLVATEALKRGYKVAGIARNPESLGIEGAEIMKGTPVDYDTVRKAIEGCDAVVSVLNTFNQSDGLFRKINAPLDVMTVSMKNLVRAMNEIRIRRVVVMTALGVGDSAKEVSAFFRFIIRISNIKYAYIDHDGQEKALEESQLDWTVVRPVMLNDKSENISVLHNLKGVGKLKPAISRNAVANFMLDCIEKGLFINQKPGISNAW